MKATKLPAEEEDLVPGSCLRREQTSGHLQGEDSVNFAHAVWEKGTWAYLLALFRTLREGMQ